MPSVRVGPGFTALTRTPLGPYSAAQTFVSRLMGQGFAISSRWMFAPELESGEVVPVLEEWSLPPMDLWVIYPSGRLTTAKARAFVKWFEAIIDQA